MKTKITYLARNVEVFTYVSMRNRNAERRGKTHVTFARDDEFIE